VVKFYTNLTWWDDCSYQSLLVFIFCNRLQTTSSKPICFRFHK
jgi:hypothetical protein